MTRIVTNWTLHAEVLTPVIGDVIVVGRARPDEPLEFVVLDATTDRELAGVFVALREAIRSATLLGKRRGAQAVWHINVNDRGSPIGPLTRVRHLPPSEQCAQ